MIKTLAVVALAMLVSACAPPLSTNYTPSSTVTGEGAVSVKEFKYIPAENGDVDANQIANTALGSIKIDAMVSDLVRNGIISEFKFAGYKLNDDAVVLEADINKFKAGDLGYSVDWILDVDYRLKKDSAIAYKKNVVVAFNGSKFIGLNDAMYKAIRLSFEELLSDKEIRSLLK